MKLERYRIDKLPGVHRNAVEGLVAPDRLYNLAADRMGGYRPLGSSEDMLINLTGTRIGYDMLGYSSFTDALGAYQLFDGTTLSTTDKDAVALAVAAGTPVHVPGVGAYSKHDSFAVYDSGGLIAQPGDSLATFDVQGEAVNFDDPLYAVAHNQTDLWVAVGADGALVTSADGNTWTVRDSGTTEDLHGIAFGNSQWVAVGANGTALKSADGLTWEVVTSNTSNHLNSAVYGGTTWVAVGDAGTVITWDGAAASWTVQAIGTTSDITGVVYGESVFVLCTGKDYNTRADLSTFTSPDGAAWTERYSQADAARGMNAVAHNGTDKFVAVGHYDGPGDADEQQLASTDAGVTWTLGGSSLKRLDWLCVAYGGGQWLAGATGGSLYISPDAEPTNWTLINIGLPTEEHMPDGVAVRGVAYDGTGTYVAVGGTTGTTVPSFIRRSTNGINWTGAGIEGGTYDLLAVNILLTRGGMLATGFTTGSFIVETGQRLTVTENLPATGEYFTQVYVKRDPDDDTSLFVLDKTLTPGDGSYDISPAQTVSTTIGDDGRFLLAAYDDLCLVHAGRVWAVPSAVEADYEAHDTEASPADLASPTTLIYTDINWVNLVRSTNFVKFKPLQSETITALASTPTGLLVFFDNEAHIVYGDPALGNLETELYTDIVGSDAVQPAQFGAIVFTIWKGEIYALTGGQAQKVSDPVHLPADPFTQVVAEPETRDLIAITQGGSVYRYDVDRQFWSDSVVSAASLLPHRDSTGTRFLDASGNVHKLNKSATPTTPEVTFTALDLGDRFTRKGYRKVRIPVGDYSINALDKPRMYYAIDSTDNLTTSYVEARQYQDELIFTLPKGKVSRTADFRFEFRGMGLTNTIEPGWEVEYGVHGRRR